MIAKLPGLGLKTQAAKPYLSAMLQCTPSLRAGAGGHGTIAAGEGDCAPNQLLIERHLSNIYRTEIFRQHCHVYLAHVSLAHVSFATSGVICGFGPRDPLPALRSACGAAEPMAAERKPAPVRRESMGKLNVDPALIERLAELLQRTGLTEIEVAEGDAKVRVARAPAPIAQMAVAPEPSAAGGASLVAGAAPAAASATDRHPGAVRAPMVGTVYLTPEPGSPPFVDVGAEVREGQTLLIIEAMKVMNPIRAPRGGRIANVLVSNGDPVEYGELLLVIE